ncbi:MAG: IS5 family transposase [bacterium]
MLKQDTQKDQEDLFKTRLENLIDHKHPLILLSHQIQWEELEKEFERFYNKDFGRPAIPIRAMVSLLILKQMFDESDESVLERWRENPYWQYFSGEQYFQWHLPCEHSELPKFRGRIGESGVEKIFEQSIKLHGKDALELEVVPDTSVQEKNITYPTDVKLYLKVIQRCLRLGHEFGIEWRQSYKRTVKRLRFETRYARIPSRAKQGRRAKAKIKTIAGRLFRELNRKLSQEIKEAISKQLEIMDKILSQKRDSKNKIYSLHEPEVSCIAKGKEHKKYEFGSKVSVLITKNSGIVVGALNFQGNPYDGNTLESQLEQSERLRGIKATRAIVDEGYRGRLMIGDTEIIRVHQRVKKNYNKRKWRLWFRRRASVEAIISHLKRGHRLGRNYLKGTIGDSINLMLSAAAFNFKKLMKKLVFIFRNFEYAFLFLFFIFFTS